MKYLGYIKKLRLKTIWDESETNRTVSGNPDSQWTLLINCGKTNWIGLKSLNPPTVHYYHVGQKVGAIQEKLRAIGATIDQSDGEFMAFVPLNRLPELCKIVRAKKKRLGPSEEVTKRGIEALEKYRKANANGTHRTQDSTQGGGDA